MIDHPVYDCLYLACAETDGAPLVTADTKLQHAAATYPSVDVWHILDPQIVERIASGATALVIEEATVREAIAAHVAFDQTAETVISKTRPHDPRYEAGLGGHWKAGLDRLIGKSLNTS